MLRIFARINWSSKNDDKMPLIVVLTKNDWIDREWRICRCESPMLMRFVSKITLGVIDEDSCRSYVNLHLEKRDTGESFHRETIDTILLLAGGHPYIMNEALKILNGYDASIKNNSKIDKERVKLQSEIEVVTELLQKCVEENAHSALDQAEYEERYTTLVERYENIKKELDGIKDKCLEQRAKRESTVAFIKEL
ncbi:hypothetical protein K2F43_08360 [Clostridium estertheticum]|uniref:hypothetical protein n=1 Tax=Clostridium estertheticum TaxID=238834 RepID=UPI001C6EB03E|nr:hypothetical protein [Clostridium estertheticum]MBW9171217.1 hypothetical protein [Clostridium estertheticum]WLC73926.1 hypothetical protein KTC99_14180 [Clostridium estertheticum]